MQSSSKPIKKNLKYSNYQSKGLKFKTESAGNYPEKDEDLHTCPARIRHAWPSKITTWWTPDQIDQRPPFSYATLIAHAILSSTDGRLTLSDIYTWISKKYPFYSIRRSGWQNSIRHNLSLNKKWFCKIDRKPTQTNPGKGCYWTLVAGIEYIFINNLTKKGNHHRKQHDNGLTTEVLSSPKNEVCSYQSGNAATSPLPFLTKSSTDIIQKSPVVTHASRSCNMLPKESSPSKMVDNSGIVLNEFIDNQTYEESMPYLEEASLYQTIDLSCLSDPLQTPISMLSSRPSDCSPSLFYEQETAFSYSNFCIAQNLTIHDASLYHLSGQLLLNEDMLEHNTKQQACTYISPSGQALVGSSISSCDSL
ncbi:fork head domain-containing protein [Blakeslea trispora]|nr:fork head domain-containing protein [Blakeslea trispora]